MYLTLNKLLTYLLTYDDEAQFVVELTIAFRLGFGHHLRSGS